LKLPLSWSTSIQLLSIFAVVMRLKMPGEEGEKNIGLFFGYLGLFNTVG
jgi:hypothetical protein